MKLRRRISIRYEAFTRTVSSAIFWMRHGHAPRQAWNKAKVTL